MSSPVQSMSNKDKKILLVDDDDFLLDMYSVKFKEKGFHLEIAHHGLEALEKLRRGKFEVILLDIVMPSIDGFDILRKIKKEKLAEGSVIIILTNLGQREDIDKGLALGADDYIVKAHFTPSEVVAKVKTFLDR